MIGLTAVSTEKNVQANMFQFGCGSAPHDWSIPLSRRWEPLEKDGLLLGHLLIWNIPGGP